MHYTKARCSIITHAWTAPLKSMLWRWCQPKVWTVVNQKGLSFEFNGCQLDVCLAGYFTCRNHHCSQLVINSICELILRSYSNRHCIWIFIWELLCPNNSTWKLCPVSQLHHLFSNLYSKAVHFGMGQSQKYYLRVVWIKQVPTVPNAVIQPHQWMASPQRKKYLHFK